jgi:hypothetical protein
MFGGIGGLFNRFSRMDDETYNRGMDRYGQFRERFGGGYQPNMFSSFAGMDDETFNRGMQRLGGYAEQYGQGNPMFRSYQAPPPPPADPMDGILESDVVSEETPLPVDGPDRPDAAQPQPSYQPMKGGAGRPQFQGTQPYTQPYYQRQFTQPRNPYASGYGMGYNNSYAPMDQRGYNGTGAYGYSGAASNSGKGGRSSGNPYSGQPAGAGKGGANNMGTYNMMSSGPM